MLSKCLAHRRRVRINPAFSNGAAADLKLHFGGLCYAAKTVKLVARTLKRFRAVKAEKTSVQKIWGS
jgi:hypothetical protein